MDEHTSHELAYRKGYEAGKPKWIPVTERLPEPETEVLVLAERKIYSFKEGRVTTHHTVTTGMYEDGSKNTEDSKLSAVFAIVAERPRLVSEEQLRRGMPCMNMALRIRSWGDA
jgi:hypothetical protein